MQKEQVRKIVYQAMEDLKAVDIECLDISNLSSVADYMIIASGTSRRHVNAISENVVKLIKENQMQPLGIEGADESDWVLVDLGDVIVNVMMPDTRVYYDLEKLWHPISDQDKDSSAT